MCDYSLQHVASRPAKVGDELTITQFPGTFTRGFAAVGKPKLAVCLLPGTELAFVDEAKDDHPLRWLLPRSRFGKIGEKVARFRQINVSNPETHHDALEFGNGKIVLVTRLLPGQRATVLQLPASAQPLPKAEDQDHVLLLADQRARREESAHERANTNHRS